MTAHTALGATDTAGILFCVSELFLGLAKRSKAGGVSKDRGSLWLLWTVIVICAVSAHELTLVLPQANSPFLRSLGALGTGVFAGGLVLRWWAILYLGRYFTVDVSVAADQKVIATGPYRLIRHPAYTGALMAFLGLGILFSNWASLVVLTVPILAAFMRRIAVEEGALQGGLGEGYIAYSARTKRLIPWIF
jgi:protein-S-isoprenylcysteine O-methyltransferase